jgi:hypothetical protein
MDCSKLHVKDKVWIAQSYGWYDNQYTIGVVVKITPTNLVDVLIGCSTTPTRFTAEGKERCEFSRRWIDDLPFDVRGNDIDRKARAKRWNS